MHDRKLTLLVGSNDQSIHLYRIKSKKYKLKQTLVSYKLGIKSLDFNVSFMDGYIANRLCLLFFYVYACVCVL